MHKSVLHPWDQYGFKTCRVSPTVFLVWNEWLDYVSAIEFICVVGHVLALLWHRTVLLSVFIEVTSVVKLTWFSSACNEVKERRGVAFSLQSITWDSFILWLIAHTHRLGYMHTRMPCVFWSFPNLRLCSWTVHLKSLEINLFCFHSSFYLMMISSDELPVCVCWVASGYWYNYLYFILMLIYINTVLHSNCFK